MGLAAELKQKKGLDSKIEPGTPGQFDVIVDGRLVFSKHRESRFPEPGEVANLL